MTQFFDPNAYGRPLDMASQTYADCDHSYDLILDNDYNINFRNKRLTRVQNAINDQDAVTLITLQDECKKVKDYCTELMGANTEKNSTDNTVTSDNNVFETHVAQFEVLKNEFDKIKTSIGLVTNKQRNQIGKSIINEIDLPKISYFENNQNDDNINVPKTIKECVTQLINIITNFASFRSNVDQTLNAIDNPTYIGYFNGLIDTFIANSESMIGNPELKLAKFILTLNTNKANIFSLNFDDIIGLENGQTFTFYKPCSVNMDICVTKFDPMNGVIGLEIDLLHIHSDQIIDVMCSLYKNQYKIRNAQQELKLNQVTNMNRIFKPGDKLQIRVTVVHTEIHSVHCNLELWFKLVVDSFTPKFQLESI